MWNFGSEFVPWTVYVIIIAIASKFYCRFSRMQHYSFLERHLTLPRSFLPWTSSMIASQPKPTTPLFPLQCDQLLDLQKRPPTAIIHKRMTQRHTGLQWVSKIIISIIVIIFFGPVLHPQYKLKYFEGANWEKDWIDTAEELVSMQFNQSYCKTSGMDTATKEVVKLSVSFIFVVKQKLGY